MSDDRFDVMVIGSGIVGLATARAIVALRPDWRVAVLDKEDRPATHQTGRNSGVIHAGLYYAPGSLKARMSVAGAERMYAYCRERDIPVENCGKVVVATDSSQIPALDELHRRAEANGVPVDRLDGAGLAAHEPHVAGVDGLYVHTTGIVDYGEVARTMSDELVATGAVSLLGFEVSSAHLGTDEVQVSDGERHAAARWVVNCAGLQVDRVAALLGHEPSVQIIPFRGEYWQLNDEGAALVNALIYPVPDADLPFLGVHFTRNISGRVEVGPNAVLALAREAYGRAGFNWSDLTETLRYPGFRRLARQFWRTGAAEQWRSLVRPAFVRDARRLIPDLEPSHIDSFRSGIRAQAVSADGSLVKDFIIEEGPRAIHVMNAPSPAATASLPIGEHIAGVVVDRLTV